MKKPAKKRAKAAKAKNAKLMIDWRFFAPGAIIFCIAFFAAAVTVYAAWEAPTQQPPNGNAPGFIYNQTAQQTGGNLNISGSGTFGSLCFGSDCKSSWLQVGGLWTADGADIYNLNTGRVGIGAGSPGGTLQINPKPGEEALIIRLPGTNAWSAINVQDSGGNSLFRVMESGNIGIGVPSLPSAKTEIWSSINDTDTTYNGRGNLLLFNNVNAGNEQGAYLTFGSYYTDPISGNSFTTRAGVKGGTDVAGNDGSGYLSFYTNGAAGNTLTEKMRIDKDGNVGIGTSAPIRPLNVKSLSASDTHLLIQTGTQNAINQGLDLVSYADNSAAVWNYQPGTLKFATNNNERMAIDSSGNVGIGITPATYKLYVSGSARVNSLNINGTWNLPTAAGTTSQYLRGDGTWQAVTVPAETDPQVDAVTDSKWCRGTGSAVTCDQTPPTDTNTTYSAGNGLTLTGTTFSINTSQTQARVSGTCSAGYSIRAIAADGSVTCEYDNDTNTTYSAGTGLTLSGTTFSVTSGTYAPYTHTHTHVYHDAYWSGTGDSGGSGAKCGTMHEDVANLGFSCTSYEPGSLWDYIVMQCPAGYTAVGGGAYCEDNRSLRVSNPQWGGKSQWKVSCGGDLTDIYYAYIRCESNTY